MTQDTAFMSLLQSLFSLLAKYRTLFSQGRLFHRLTALVLAELFSFGRHTLTQNLLALGLVQDDWSAWYRLFSRRRFDPLKAATITLHEILQHVPPDQPLVLVVDPVWVPRHSHKMPGTSWMKAPYTAPFQPGLQRGQRFLGLYWLVPLEDGCSRAIPLIWWPAFPQNARPSPYPPCKSWEAAIESLRWIRQKLDEAGRYEQEILVIADGEMDKAEFWRNLPERTTALVGTARNRVLYELPPREKQGRGRPRKYGASAPKPHEVLLRKKGWLRFRMRIRGKMRTLKCRVEGPFLRSRVPGQPMFLLVVKGRAIKQGKRTHRRRPTFLLVPAKQQDGKWVLPFPLKELLLWAWQRWEVEVAHREMKSGLGLGEKQCWSAEGAVVSVQWSAWLYGVLVLAAYRVWGVCGGPKRVERWWRGSWRWSLGTMWRTYRMELWGREEFRALWVGTRADWGKKEVVVAGMWNAVLGSARI